MKSDKILLNLVMMLICFVVLSTAELFSAVGERKPSEVNAVLNFDAERIGRPDKPFFLDSPISCLPGKKQPAEFTIQK